MVTCAAAAPPTLALRLLGAARWCEAPALDDVDFHLLLGARARLVGIGDLPGGIGAAVERMGGDCRSDEGQQGDEVNDLHGGQFRNDELLSHESDCP